MSTAPNYWVVVPAAGNGRRFSASILKQYALLRGKPVVAHTLSNLLSVNNVSAVVFVHGQNDGQWQNLAEIKHEKIITTAGGNERVDSVRNGLLALSNMASPSDWVLVHDAARPCCFAEDIEYLMAQLQHHPVGGILALPVTDTVKRANGENNAIETVDRNELWRAQTPQMFRYGVLLDALNNPQPFTDEAQAIENVGLQPKLVKGKSQNIKITHQEDLALAEFYLSQRDA
jgi:2-C-methyl-D-erythritol 4-phosphate cytidylyltransferase